MHEFLKLSIATETLQNKLISILNENYTAVKERAMTIVILPFDHRSLFKNVK